MQLSRVARISLVIPGRTLYRDRNGSLSRKRELAGRDRDVHKCRPPLVNCCHALFAGEPQEMGEHKRVCVFTERDREKERESPTICFGENFRRPSYFLRPCTQITSPQSASVTSSDIASDTMLFFFSLDVKRPTLEVQNQAN